MEAAVTQTVPSPRKAPRLLVPWRLCAGHTGEGGARMNTAQGWDVSPERLGNSGQADPTAEMRTGCHNVWTGKATPDPDERSQSCVIGGTIT